MFEQDYDPIDKFVQQGQGGVSLIVEFVDPDGNIVDVSGFTAPNIRIQFPDDATRIFPAAFVTDGQDGQIVYETQAIDLATQWGTHYLQGLVTDTDGNVIFSAVRPFYVRKNLVPVNETDLPMPIYVGNPTTNGSYRINLNQSNGHLELQQLIAGVWTTLTEWYP